MPKVVGLYKNSRSGLKHNMGGWFEKKKKTPPEPKPATEPKPKEPISSIGKEARSAIERRKKALKEAMQD